MFFAALLGVTLTPVLMVLLIRGKITRKQKPRQPLLIWAYRRSRKFRAAFPLADALAAAA
jgi:Cu/Ag efflux pump CusA